MLKDVTPPPPHLWAWETATGVDAEAEPGLFTANATLPLTLLAAFGFSVLLWPVMGWQALPTAFLFGRLLALDATTYTLPNIYTLPLLLVGWVHAATQGRLLAAWGIFLGLMLLGSALHHSRLKAGLGGGDAKLLAAMGAFLALPTMLWAVAIGCILWLPVTFWAPRTKVPMGVPLLLGWCMMIRFEPNLTASLQNLIVP